MAVLGVDGWRGRWVGALLDGRSVTLLVLEHVAAVLAVPDVDVVAIDMPIGLSDDGVRVRRPTGWWRCTRSWRSGRPIRG
ncbi:DUF429 domain-containing protein [Blastococcus sp. HT6-30]|uniref:DUF429 domain-containing protein n=1 Tax=Blastococcus sp. HT6-30 TaxID=3144843 RepID=UPI00321B6298